MKKIFFNARRTLQAICLCSLVCLGALKSYAGFTQYHQTGSVITQATPQNAVPIWMNNAEFKNSVGTVYAEVWDEGPFNNCYLEVHSINGGGSTGAVQLGVGLINPGDYIIHPDVILGGDNTHNYIGVVYTYVPPSGITNVYFEVYTIGNITTPTINLTPCGTHIWQVTSQANAGEIGDAHIDIANQLVAGNTVTANEFAIVYERMSTCQVGPDFGAQAAAGPLKEFANCSTGAVFTNSACLNNTTNPTFTAGLQPDIAVRWDVGSAKYDALATYSDPGLGNIYLARWQITPNTVTTGAVMDNPGIGNADFPRIDVVDAHHPYTVAGNAVTEVVYRYADPANFNIPNVVQKNNVLVSLANPGEEITSYYNTAGGTYNNPNTKPVVTFGTSNSANLALHNLYSMAYATPAIDSIFVQNTDLITTTGVATQRAGAGLVDYYAANNNNGSTPDDPVAISSYYVYNGGMDIQAEEVYVCWLNTANAPFGTIDCKTTQNVPVAFKPTEVNGLATGSQLRVYPNPADDELYVQEGSKKVKSYSISDVLGRNVLTFAGGQPIQVLNIKALPKGLYVLHVLNEDKSNQDVKIEKE